MLGCELDLALWGAIRKQFAAQGVSGVDIEAENEDYQLFLIHGYCLEIGDV